MSQSNNSQTVDSHTSVKGTICFLFSCSYMKTLLNNYNFHLELRSFLLVAYNLILLLVH